MGTKASGARRTARAGVLAATGWAAVFIVLAQACSTPRSELSSTTTSDAAAPPSDTAIGPASGSDGRPPEVEPAAPPISPGPDAAAVPATMVADASPDVPAGGCSPGTTRCSDNSVQFCNAGRMWVTSMVCPGLCTAGACTGACLADTKRCTLDGKAVEVCHANGSGYNPLMSCPAGCDPNGPACKPCPAGTRICSSEGSDDFCAANADPKHCGPGCKTCPDNGGTATCNGSSCDVVCGADQFICFPQDPTRKLCTARFRGFESGTNEGMEFFDATKGDTDRDYAPTRTLPHSGAWSVPIRFDRFPQFQFGMDLCVERVKDALALGGKSLTFWYYADQKLPDDTVLTVWAGTTTEQNLYGLATRQWTQVQVAFPVTDDNRYNHFSIDFRTQTPPGAPVTIYIDDVLVSQ